MFSLKIQNFKPRKLAKNLAVNVEKRIQFTGRCTMKVSEREMSRKKKQKKTILLILKLPCAILACIFLAEL